MSLVRGPVIVYIVCNTLVLAEVLNIEGGRAVIVKDSSVLEYYCRIVQILW